MEVRKRERPREGTKAVRRWAGEFAASHKLTKGSFPVAKDAESQQDTHKSQELTAFAVLEMGFFFSLEASGTVICQPWFN